MSELRQLETTYSAVLSMDTSSLDAALAQSLDCSLVAVGSGGSLSAAHFVCRLHQQAAGRLAIASTPLEILTLLSDRGSRPSLVNSAVMCLSAGGSNADINRAFRAIIETEPRHLLALCARRGSPLARIAAKHDYVNLIDFSLPSKKDGFLATNSLLAFTVLLARSYSHLLGNVPAMPPSVWGLFDNYDSLDSALDDMHDRLRPLLEREHLIVLHGAEMKAAAHDIESKFTEAALGSVQLGDYRNFAHGRHHWLAKRGEESAVLALTDSGSAALARRTLDLLPSSIPTLLLQFPGTSPWSPIAPIITGFLITAIAGELRGIDPGRPRVPQFGRRLYHLGIGNPPANARKDSPPIQRKTQVCPSSVSDVSEGYTVFVRSLRHTTYGGLVLDYDGTLCGSRNRSGPLDSHVARELIRLLRAGVPLGIATGRGKSVRTSLQESLPKTLWKRVIVGYYSGAECSLLADDSSPDSTDKACTALEEVVRALSSDECVHSLSTMTVRRKQICLEPIQATSLSALWTLVGSHISRLGAAGVKAMMSAHSIDVLAPGVSKRNVIDTVRVVFLEGRPVHILCVGDRGTWPGNDSDLLSAAYSLSVDTVSPTLDTCWNIAPAGIRGPQATVFYLKCLVPRDGQLRFYLDRVKRTRK
jgi:fructoselysine-6-P-deglycase FrlB-like protein